jgi:sterol desaturase/sphingolipid hydroxylase (fatty acid hydroxylase superfamily)
MHTLFFSTLNVTLSLMHRYQILARYKIQPNKYPTDQLMRRGLVDVLIKHTIAPFLLYFLWPVAQHCGIHASPELPSITEVLGHLLFHILVQDTIFYWSHRLLHVPFFYKRIHKQHHQFYTPVGISSEYAHPVEDFASQGAVIAGPLILGSHMVTVYLWLLLRIWETVDAHSGYSFPFPLSPFSLFGVADQHDYHHSQNKGCYGSFFGLWDWICGTDADYKRWKASKAQRVVTFSDTANEVKSRRQ